ncbi:Tetratricopeptide repeat (TPR)-like superfamily protein [Raphanus sativus]|nr:Tetratricopeptide repeat (TPR)-like superfamily protein [Raphanus sativus]
MIQSVAKCVRAATAATIRGTRMMLLFRWSTIRSFPRSLSKFSALGHSRTIDHQASPQDSKATVLLAMSDLLYESGNISEAFERLKQVMSLSLSSLSLRVVALEALVAESLFGGLENHGMCKGNVALSYVSLAATFALGQLESHIGNFGDAEETLTCALTRAEEYYGHNHPVVGVILTGVALM